MPRTSPTWWRRFAISIRAPATPSTAPRCRRSSPTSWSIACRTAPGRWNSTATPCRACWSISSITRASPAKAQSKADKDYLADRLSAANWLVKTLHQRATTILKVASEIVRQQEKFFLHGVQHLKPLIRRNIADEIGMHESTVSRVAANKFMATPRGLFELRYFFSAAIQARGRRRQPLRRGGPLPHQGVDRQGTGRGRPVRRPAGRGAQERGRGHRPPDCC